MQRPQLPPEERAWALEYLESAPVVLSARGYDRDMFAPGLVEVPMTFHTDGTWVWPGAVGYYLRRYNMPPDPDLVMHLRTNGFRVPHVDKATKEHAATTITG